MRILLLLGALAAAAALAGQPRDCRAVGYCPSTRCYGTCPFDSCVCLIPPGELSGRCWHVGVAPEPTRP